MSGSWPDTRIWKAIEGAALGLLSAVFALQYDWLTTAVRLDLRHSQTLASGL